VYAVTAGFFLNSSSYRLFFRRRIILKFYIRVFEAGIAFALVLAVVFAAFKTQQSGERTEETEKKNALSL